MRIFWEITKDLDVRVGLARHVTGKRLEKTRIAHVHIEFVTRDLAPGVSQDAFFCQVYGFGYGQSLLDVVFGEVEHGRIRIGIRIEDWGNAD